MGLTTSAAAKPACILAMQGGGAMGAYHIGAYQALQEHSFTPDWISGISIGAFNGAIIAGNPPGQGLHKLEAFWSAISRPSLLPADGGVAVRTLEHLFSYAGALSLGQPNFFSPRPINPYFAPPGVAATSFYDTSPLLVTLPQFVDFAWLNAAGPRLSVGVTNVRTGHFSFFDSRGGTGPIGAEHVIASGSLPPGFPATQIGAELYWDGACVSNSPLEALASDPLPGHTVVFLLDLWSASGPAPETMAAVEWRVKQIRYATSTTHHVHALAAKLQLRQASRMLGDPEAASAGNRVNIVHIIYHPGADQISASDAEFSRGSIAERREAGLRDMRRALAEEPWQRTLHARHYGCAVHRVTKDGIETLPPEGEA